MIRMLTVTDIARIARARVRTCRRHCCLRSRRQRSHPVTDTATRDAAYLTAARDAYAAASDHARATRRPEACPAAPFRRGHPTPAALTRSRPMRAAGVAFIAVAFVVGCLSVYTPVAAAQLVLSWTAIVAALAAGLFLADGGAT